MFNLFSRKLITATLAATLSLGAGLAATSAQAHSTGYHGHHSHWGHGYWRGSLYPLVVRGADCYSVRKRIITRHGHVRYRYVKVCD